MRLIIGTLRYKCLTYLKGRNEKYQIRPLYLTRLKCSYFIAFFGSATIKHIVRMFAPKLGDNSRMIWQYVKRHLEMFLFYKYWCKVRANVCKTLKKGFEGQLRETMLFVV